MKIKQVFAQILLSIVVLLAARTVVGGFVFSSSVAYTAVFLVLFASTDWMANRVRIFFLLPSLLPVPIIIHSLFIGGLLYLAEHFLSGISITVLNDLFWKLAGDVFSRQQFGEFGTIVVVALFCGIVYQTINWLFTEK